MNDLREKLKRCLRSLGRLRHATLSEVVRSSGKRLNWTGSMIPAVGGVYAFWWTGSVQKFSSAIRSVSSRVFPGPDGRPVEVDLRPLLSTVSAQRYPALYVGKTATDVRSRVGLHLMLGTAVRISSSGRSKRQTKRPTTTCQLRYGLEQLFPTVRDSRNLVVENVGLSFIPLPKDDDALVRFFLEDLAIGSLVPILNVDIER